MVELPDALDEKVKQKIETINDRENERIKKRPNKVTPVLCDTLKELYETDLTNAEILEITPINSPDTLYRHINGACEHISGRVSYSDCGWIRYHARAGAPTETLSLLYNVENFAIRQHATGKCWHEHGCETVTSEKLKENANKVYHTISVCEECGQEFEHKRYNDRRFCSRVCNTRYAGRQAHK